MKKVLLAVLLCASVVVAGCGGSDSSPYADIRISEDTDGFAGIGLDDPYQLPVVQFQDTDGSQVSWPQQGRPWPVTVVLFAYTNCPDVCNTQLADFTAARRGLAQELKDDVGLVMVSTDPERDTTAAIRKYLDRFDEDYVGLRTDEASLAAAAESLGVALTGKEPAPSGDGYEVGHGAQLIAFDSSGRAPVMWLPGTPVRDIRADLEQLLQGQ